MIIIYIKCNDVEFLIANFYRCNVAETSVLTAYEDAFKAFADTKLPVVVTGDFNLPGINWDIPSAPTTFSQNKFLDAFLDFGFVQKVLKPTRLKKILDLVLTNDPHFVYDVTVGNPVGLSDHNTVCFKINLCMSHDISKLRLDWDNADILGLSAQWS